jgi:outer membrane protein assembly factor BamB
LVFRYISISFARNAVAMKIYSQRKFIFVSLVAVLLFSGSPSCSSQGQDRPQWGEYKTRNMISYEVNLPEKFDPNTRQNIKWSVSLGSDNYSTPVISGGRVLIGANNADPRDPRHEGDRGVLLCLNESDGSLCWQLVVPRIEGVPFNDWPMISICSPPTVEGDRIYVVSNRAEVLCLDLDGQADGNDGPFQGENWYMAPGGDLSYEVTSIDADIIWSYDMRLELGICTHDSPQASILIDGDYLYLNTNNGVDNNHNATRCPDAPSLIALDKHTGRLVAKDNENFGPRIFHNGWSSPAMAEINGKKLLFYAGPDAIVYAFEALSENPPPGQVHLFKKVWHFDCDPDAPKENIHDYKRNRTESPSVILGMPVFYKNRIYVTGGGDYWWGKREAWLKCIDASKTGDITGKGEIWSAELERHSFATPAISNGLVYVTDGGKNLHCIDAENGNSYWTHQFQMDTWASVLVADEKVYVGSKGRDYWVLSDSKEKEVLHSVQLDSPIHSTSVAANGVLYVGTMKRLYAISRQK